MFLMILKISPYVLGTQLWNTLDVCLLVEKDIQIWLIVKKYINILLLVILKNAAKIRWAYI